MAEIVSLAEAAAAKSGQVIPDESLFHPHTHNQVLMIRVLATLREMKSRTTPPALDAPRSRSAP